MAKIIGEHGVISHQDIYLDMVARRRINEDFPDVKVDMNAEGFRIAHRYLGLTAGESVLDVGTSSGEFIIKAARETGTRAHIYGLEPDLTALDYLSDDYDNDQFTFVWGVGEDIQLPDNTVRVSSAHNVLFRADDKLRMINEMQRVTEPEGFLLFSTNARYHAFWRHTFERVVSRMVQEELDRPVVPPTIPAEGAYLEEIPGILKQANDLEIVGKPLIHFSPVRITRDRIPAYLYPIEASYNRVKVDGANEETAYVTPEAVHAWRETTAHVIKPYIEMKIDNMAKDFAKQGIEEEPYFADVVFRGLVVARNKKP